MARLLKFNNEVVYQQLLTPEVPFELDYCEVVFSLCDVMCRIYAMFVEEVRNALRCTWQAPLPAVICLALCSRALVSAAVAFCFLRFLDHMLFVDRCFLSFPWMALLYGKISLVSCWHTPCATEVDE